MTLTEATSILVPALFSSPVALSEFWKKFRFPESSAVPSSELFLALQQDYEADLVERLKFCMHLYSKNNAGMTLDELSALMDALKRLDQRRFIDDGHRFTHVNESSTLTDASIAADTPERTLPTMVLSETTPSLARSFMANYDAVNDALKSLGRSSSRLNLQESIGELPPVNSVSRNASLGRGHRRNASDTPGQEGGSGGRTGHRRESTFHLSFSAPAFKKPAETIFEAANITTSARISVDALYQVVTAHQAGAALLNLLNHQPSPQEETETIKRLMTTAQFQAGHEVFIISMKWWRLWRQYVDDAMGAVGRPGAIDNMDLIAAHQPDTAPLPHFKLLRENLHEDLDFVVAPQQVWKQLWRWYSGGPTVKRQVIPRDRPSSRQGRPPSILGLSLALDLYPLVLDIGFLKSKKPHGRLMCCAEITGHDLKYLVAHQLGVEWGPDWTLWMQLEDTEPHLMQNLDLTLRVIGLTNQHCVLVQQSSRRRKASEIVRQFWSARVESEWQTGHVGLRNLGNTCFLNAALQLLMHLEPLADYFREEQSGRDAVLGCTPDARCVHEFSDLVKRFWSTRSSSSIVPYSFRTALVTRYPQFSGREQQDAQEALNLILDCIHMDMNKSIDRQVYTNPDYDGHSDHALASIYWLNHLRRDRSLIVSLFEGQFKSHAQCLTCHHEIVQFNPFMFLSLPLPESHTRVLKITMVRVDAKPLVCKIRVPNRDDTSVQHVIDALDALVPGQHPLFVADVQANYIFSFYRSAALLSEIRERDTLVIYEIPADERDPPSQVRVVLLHRRLKYEWSMQGRKLRPTLYGIPIVHGFTRSPNGQWTGRSLYEQTLARLQACFETGTLLEEVQVQLLKNGDKSPTSSSSSRTESAWVHQYPFLLKRVNYNGTRCGVCQSIVDRSGTLACMGCVLPADDAPVQINDGDSLAIEWRVKRSKFTATQTLQQTFSHADTHSSAQNTREALDGAVALEDVLREYEKPEWMSEQDFYCPKCKAAREGVKRETLYRLPSILLVQLKRFSYTQYGSVKNDRIVNVPVDTLDMSQYRTVNAEGDQRNLMELLPLLNRDNSHTPLPPMDPRKMKRDVNDDEYELCGLISHFGYFQDGHYTATMRDGAKSNTWYTFNDHQCTETEISEKHQGVAENAYVLAYRQKSLPATIKSWSSTSILDAQMARLEQELATAAANNLSTRQQQ